MKQLQNNRLAASKHARLSTNTHPTPCKGTLSFIAIKALLIVILIGFTHHSHAQKVMKMQIVDSTVVGFICPDSLNWFHALLLEDTNFVFNNYRKYPNQLEIDKKAKLFKYSDGTGSMNTIELSQVDEPIDFLGTKWQTYELTFNSGMTGSMTLFEVSRTNKSIWLEYEFNGQKEGFVGTLSEESAKKLKPLHFKKKNTLKL